MSASSPPSPRPTSAASYQNSSPRLPSPLNPSLNLFSPPLPIGHTPRNSPVGETSDTLSPLRERLDPGLVAPPLSSPGVARPRTSSFSRSPRSCASPELPPSMGPTPVQPHRAYARHPSPSSSPFAQAVPFPSSSPRPSCPLAVPSHSPITHSPRPLSPPFDSPRRCSPSSMHRARCSFSFVCVRFLTSRIYSPVLHSKSCRSLPLASLVPNRSFNKPLETSVLLK